MKCFVFTVSFVLVETSYTHSAATLHAVYSYDVAGNIDNVAITFTVTKVNTVYNIAIGKC